MRTIFYIKLITSLIGVLISTFCFGSNFISDSLVGKKIMEKETEALRDLKVQNENYFRKGKNQNLNFLIQLSFDSSGNYINNEVLSGKESWFAKSPALENSLNSRLRQVYIHDTIECYLIFVNYFDLKIKAAIPPNATLNDLFNTGKFFNENSNIDSLKKKNDEIFKRIVSGSIKTTNRSCIVLSYSNFNGIYDSKKLKTYTLFSHAVFTGAPNSSSVYLNKIYDGLLNKLTNTADPKYRCGNNAGMAETAVKTLESAAKVGKLGNRILKTYSTSELETLLAQFTSNNDYYSLTVRERLHILSVFVNDGMHGQHGDNPGAEGYANKVIRYTPQKDAVRILHGLEKESVLNNDAAYTGDKSNKDALIYRLAGRTDDGWFFGLGGDNYKSLNQNIADLVLSSKESIDTFSTVTPSNIQNRMIYWDEHYTFQVEPVGLNKYDVELISGGEIKYKRKIVSGYNVANNVVVPVWDESYPEVTLHLFDIVVFVNKSNASMIGEAGAAPGQLNFLPALFLKYANDKVFNQTAMKVAAAAVDAATLVTGPGLLFKAARASEMAIALFETANMIGAGTDLLLNVVPTDPKLHALVDNFNGIIGVWGLARLGNGALKLGNAIEATMDEMKQISAISKQRAKDFLTAYEDAKTELASANNGLSDVQKSSIDKMKGVLEEEIGKVGGVLNDVVRGVSFEDFANSVQEFKNGANTELAQQAFGLWKDEKWVELEQLFKNHSLNEYKGDFYPPNAGYIETTPSSFQIGFEFDRYGGEIISKQFVDNGKFVSEKGSSFSSRSLPNSALSKPLKQYKVIKEIPSIQKGKAIPWFNSEGLGIQFKLPYGIDDLKKNGYIVEIN